MLLENLPSKNKIYFDNLTYFFITLGILIGFIFGLDFIK